MATSDVAATSGCADIFTLELALRTWAVGPRGMCTRSEGLLSCMDMVLVPVALANTVLDVLAASASGVNTSAFMVRLIKVFRIGRLLRPLRTVALLGELRVIACMIASSLRSLLWLLCILLALTYCFALVITQGASTYLHSFTANDTLPEESADMKTAFCSVPVTMYSFFLSMTGARSWGEFVTLISHAGMFYGALIMVYVFINLFSGCSGLCPAPTALC